MPGGPVIETRAITKRFGSRIAVDAVDLTVPRGIAFGLLGPNGAGKTTLIRMALGLARPTSGEVSLLGWRMPDDARQALGSVGGIVEEPRFYPYLTGRQNLEAWAALMRDGARLRVPGVLARTMLTDRADDAVSKYSQGMRQRLGVARALLSDPQLLVRDEPTNGLDPLGIAEFRELVRDLVENEGRTVFISSHLLDEIEKMCDQVAIVNHGAIVIQGSVRELIESGERGLLLDVDDPAAARRVLAGMPSVRRVEVRPGEILFVELEHIREAAIAAVRTLVEAGIGVASAVPSEESLEERYLAITGSARATENTT